MTRTCVNLRLNAPRPWALALDSLLCTRSMDSKPQQGQLPSNNTPRHTAVLCNNPHVHTRVADSPSTVCVIPVRVLHVPDRVLQIIGDETLSENDLGNVLTQLLPAQNVSHLIAAQMKVPPHIVEAIHKENSDTRDRFYHVLLHILKQIEPRPTWRAFAECLRSPLVNHPQLARKIEGTRTYNNISYTRHKYTR